MKSTGIVRKVDELGRIVLPIEMRRTLDIAERDALEIYVEGASVILKNTSPAAFSATPPRTFLYSREKTSARNVCGI